MASPTTTTQDTDALVSLEERILRAVELVATLRQEKEAAEIRANEAEDKATASTNDITELQAENQRLLEELDSLRMERKQVRGRIEKLLGQLDTLA